MGFIPAPNACLKRQDKAEDKAEGDVTQPLQARIRLRGINRSKGLEQSRPLLLLV